VSVFLGSLYGIGWGRGQVDAPSEIKKLEGTYNTTIRIAWRISTDGLPVEEILKYTRMPSWKQIYRRALKLNIRDFRNERRLFGSLIENTTGRFKDSIALLRKASVDHLMAYHAKKHREDDTY